MQKERREEHEKLRELNKRFLEEIESGKGWQEVKNIMEDMKDIAKRLDNMIAQVVQFDDYPHEQKLGESSK